MKINKHSKELQKSVFVSPIIFFHPVYQEWMKGFQPGTSFGLLSYILYYDKHTSKYKYINYYLVRQYEVAEDDTGSTIDDIIVLKGDLFLDEVSKEIYIVNYDNYTGYFLTKFMTVDNKVLKLDHILTNHSLGLCKMKHLGNVIEYRKNVLQSIIGNPKQKQHIEKFSQELCFS